MKEVQDDKKNSFISGKNNTNSPTVQHRKEDEQKESQSDNHSSYEKQQRKYEFCVNCGGCQAFSLKQFNSMSGERQTNPK